MDPDDAILENLTLEKIYGIYDDDPAIITNYQIKLTNIYPEKIAESKIRRIIQLIKLGADHTSYRDDQGFTNLHIAIMDDNFPFVEVMLEYDADPNLLTREGYSTLSILTANSTNVDMAYLLIRHGANVNFEDEHGTVLDSAEENGLTEIASLLKRYGAKHFHLIDPDQLDLGFEEDEDI